MKLAPFRLEDWLDSPEAVAEYERQEAEEQSRASNSTGPRWRPQQETPMQANERAFLDMLAVSEGTKGVGNDGYNVIVGGTLFHDYSKHPNVLVTLNKDGLESTAAGRYQFLKRTWDSLAAKLNLRDFSPASQDAGGLELIVERHASDDVREGRFAAAIAKCAPIWASLPGAGYGQHENELKALQAAYIRAGGQLA